MADDTIATPPLEVFGASKVIRQTAKETEFHGDRVWIQTLNDLYRGDAEREAHFEAAVKLQPIRKGQSTYNAYKSEFNGMTRDDRILFLSNHELTSGRFGVAAQNAHPLPTYPERTSECTDTEWVDLLGKYTDAIEKVRTARGKHIGKGKTKFEEDLGKLSDAVLTERCLAAHTEVLYSNTINPLLVIHSLYRAVRKADNHMEFYFQSIEHVANLSNEELQYLENEYASINSVRPNEIPT